MYFKEEASNFQEIFLVWLIICNNLIINKKNYNQNVKKNVFFWKKFIFTRNLKKSYIQFFYSNTNFRQKKFEKDCLKVKKIAEKEKIDF